MLCPEVYSAIWLGAFFRQKTLSEFGGRLKRDLIGRLVEAYGAICLIIDSLCGEILACRDQLAFGLVKFAIKI